jgi:hypothetical protein
VCDGRGHRIQAATPRQQLFVLSSSWFSSHVASCAAAGSGDASVAGPVSLRRKVRIIASADAVQQWSRTRTLAILYPGVDPNVLRLNQLSGVRCGWPGLKRVRLPPSGRSSIHGGG